MFSTLFRPFLWESKKIIILFSALESFFMLLALFYVLSKVGILKFLGSIFSDPQIFFAFILTLLLSAVVGFTTFNFGTLVRYRLPVLPFYFFMLIAIYLKSKAVTGPKALK
jgi:ABC-type sulfate transport system permease component